MKNEMTKQGAISILEQHNRWRRGEEIPQIKPAIIGAAIDKAIDIIKEVVNKEENEKTK